MASRPFLGFVALTMLLHGCTMEPAIPTTARVTVDGPIGANGIPVQLVWSSEFQAERGEDTRVFLVRADTTELTVPFRRDLDIQSHSGQRKLYVELSGADGRSALVRLRVQIQDDSWYDHTLDLSEMFHRFLYTR